LSNNNNEEMMLTDEARTNEDYEELQYIKKKDHNLFFNEDVGF
jgi:hypothetical protein